jgi:hypothetical protein
MNDPKPEEILGPNNIGMDIIEAEGEEDTRVRPLSEVIEELRAEARKRSEQQAPPPKENGEPGNS